MSRVSPPQEANDQNRPEIEIVGLAAQAQFLLVSIDRYELDPTDAAWTVVCMGREGLREIADHAMRYMPPYRGDPS